MHIIGQFPEKLYYFQATTVAIPPPLACQTNRASCRPSRSAGYSLIKRMTREFSSLIQSILLALFCAAVTHHCKRVPDHRCNAYLLSFLLQAQDRMTQPCESSTRPGRYGGGTICLERIEMFPVTKGYAGNRDYPVIQIPFAQWCNHKGGHHVQD